MLVHVDAAALTNLEANDVNRNGDIFEAVEAQFERAVLIIPMAQRFAWFQFVCSTILDKLVGQFITVMSIGEDIRIPADSSRVSVPHLLEIYLLLSFGVGFGKTKEEKPTTRSFTSTL